MAFLTSVVSFRPLAGAFAELEATKETPCFNVQDWPLSFSYRFHLSSFCHEGALAVINHSTHRHLALGQLREGPSNSEL